MSNATHAFNEFLSKKKSSNNKNTRRKYHGFNNIWSESYNIQIFHDFHTYILGEGWNAFGFKAVGDPTKAELLYGKGPKIEIVTKELKGESDKDLAWTGFYASPDISVAEGYREGGALFRIYIRKDSWDCIYKLPPGQTMAGEKALEIMINAHNKKPKFFSLTGPQDDSTKDPELSKPESIFIGSEVKNRILAIPVPKTLNSTNYKGQNTLITLTHS